MIWISTKPCITHGEGINAYMHTNIHISVSAILLLSLNLGFYCSLEKSDVLRGLLLCVWGWCGFFFV
jgi:hypothetical protein